MEPLFKVKYNKTLKDIRAFNWYVSRKLIAVTLLVGFVLNIVQMERGHDPIWIAIYLAVTSITWIILVVGVNALVLLVGTKHSWDTDKTSKTGTIDFYEDKFIDNDTESIVTTEFAKIYRIYETSEYFYIMVSANHGFIVRKDICTAECIEFLKKKKAEINH